ncbi:Mog1p/PsbP-like protein [Lentinus tigrinus ALCF2SS1-6]|uniref:Mog1p/PsbP-like protein n=1 Tax=Lentinus tigrinus ALCF2SS1-6 TaxID=1328759 RepID=A0A5C2SRF4_9APHY|nr:Mog1p/PsbP-like protein [Lentinus tigrinus ALCF2SS1-6]
MSATKELFGGSITTTLPTTLIDASNFRQVPDTQEVFISRDSGVSIIVEVLQSVDATELREAARCVVSSSWIQVQWVKPACLYVSLHFDALAHDNDAKTKQVNETTDVPNGSDGTTPDPVVLYGTQTVQKFNSQSADEVRILLALYRVLDRNIDLVMTMNVPMASADGGAVSEEDWNEAKAAFEIAAKSLRILDYGLFA